MVFAAAVSLTADAICPARVMMNWFAAVLVAAVLAVVVAAFAFVRASIAAHCAGVGFWIHE